MIHSNPPIQHHFGALLRHSANIRLLQSDDHESRVVTNNCHLPVIDLEGLTSDDEKVRLACAAEICRASSEWGFFQVVNHGISSELLIAMRKEQVKLFDAPFERKATCGLLNNSYRWGTPTATCQSQFSWSEAFHIPLKKISDEACYGEFNSLREVMNEFAAAMPVLAMLLTGILTHNLVHPKELFDDICNESTCFLLLNHYLTCPISPELFGLVPHRDSDFSTILYQDQVGCLQLMKDSNWVDVKPNQDALIANMVIYFRLGAMMCIKALSTRSMQNYMPR